MTIEIRPTHCNCHPETCCCSPFQVFRNGKRVGNSVTKELADLIEAQERDIRMLRESLAFAYSGRNLYGDDGELQDNSELPCIDYVRDDVSEIRRKIRERGAKRIAALEPPQ